MEPARIVVRTSKAVLTMLGLLFAFVSPLATNTIINHKDEHFSAPHSIRGSPWKVNSHWSELPEGWDREGLSSPLACAGPVMLDGLRAEQWTMKITVPSSVCYWQRQKSPGSSSEFCWRTPKSRKLNVCKCQCPNMRHLPTSSIADYRVKGKSRLQHVRSSIVHSQFHSGPEAQFTLTGPQMCRCDKGSLLMALPYCQWSCC